MAAVVLTAALLLPLTAHSTAELSDWYSEWLATPETSDIKVELLRDMEARHPCFPEACQLEEVMPTADYVGAVTAPPPTSAGVEQWRGLVAAYFLASDVNLALRVIACESGGDAAATNSSSGAAGLFQHIPRYWAERSTAAGWAGANIYDPTANVAVAAWLATTQGWYHWNPSRGCW